MVLAMEAVVMLAVRVLGLVVVGVSKLGVGKGGRGGTGKWRKRVGRTAGKRRNGGRGCKCKLGTQGKRRRRMMDP
jgi:uncharacterized spore protein YtfJ